MADAPTIAEDEEVGEPVCWGAAKLHSWDPVMTLKGHFIGGDCSWASKQHRTVRGPIWSMIVEDDCLEIDLAWTARFRSDPCEDLWEFIPSRLPVVVLPITKQAFTDDGTITLDLNGDRMTLFPRGWADRLKPEFVDGLPLPWERLLTLFPSVRDELKLNKPAVMAICSGRFPHLVPVISGLSKDSRILAVLEKLEDPVHKHWLLCQYLTQFLKVPNLATRVY